MADSASGPSPRAPKRHAEGFAEPKQSFKRLQTMPCSKSGPRTGDIPPLRKKLCLQDMPAEIFKHIISYVLPQESVTIECKPEMSSLYKKTFASVSDPPGPSNLVDLFLVCKQFHQEVAELLYYRRTLDIVVNSGSALCSDNIRQSMRYTSPRNFQNIRIYLRPQAYVYTDNLAKNHYSTLRKSMSQLRKGLRNVTYFLESAIGHLIRSHECNVKVICCETNGLHASALKSTDVPPMSCWDLSRIADVFDLLPWLDDTQMERP